MWIIDQFDPDDLLEFLAIGKIERVDNELRPRGGLVNFA